MDLPNDSENLNTSSDNRTIKADQLKKVVDGLREAKQIMDETGKNASAFSKFAKKWTPKILAPLKAIIPILDNLTDLHPAIGGVTTVLKGIVKLQEGRDDLDRRIAALLVELLSLLVLYPYLEPIFIDGDQFADDLRQNLDEVEVAVKKFAQFSDAYFNRKRKLRYFAFVSNGVKSEFDDMLQTIHAHTEAINRLVNWKSAVTGAHFHEESRHFVTKEDLHVEFTRISAVIEGMDGKEREIASKLDGLDGNDAINEFTRLYVEQTKITVTREIRKAFSEDLTLMLEQSSDQFNIKMQGAVRQFDDSMAQHASRILHDINAGPHDELKDDDMKSIWKRSAFRNSAKTRLLLEAVHDYFEKKLQGEVSDANLDGHRDAWTLHYIGRVIYYSAIGDAIDNDGSGYVSVQELNSFIARKPNAWTVPQWFAYWSVGARQTDWQFANAISEDLKAVTKAISKLDKAHQTVANVIHPYFDDIKRISESLYNIFDTIPEEMEQLIKNVAQEKEKSVKGSLETVKYELHDTESVNGVVALSSLRLEESILCLIHLLLRRYIVILDTSRTSHWSIQQLKLNVTSMKTTFFNVIDACIIRLENLEGVWRLLKADVSLQFANYAGGIFEDWYKYINKYWDDPSSAPDYKKYEDDDEDEDEDYEEDEAEGEPQDADDNATAEAGEDFIAEDEDDYGEEEIEPEAEESESNDRIRTSDQRIVTIEENTGTLQTKLGELEGKIATLEDLLRQLLSQTRGSSTTTPAGRKTTEDSRKREQVRDLNDNDSDNDNDDNNDDSRGGDDPDEDRQPDDDDENGTGNADDNDDEREYDGGADGGYNDD